MGFVKIVFWREKVEQEDETKEGEKNKLKVELEGEIKDVATIINWLIENNYVDWGETVGLSEDGENWVYKKELEKQHALTLHERDLSKERRR